VAKAIKEEYMADEALKHDYMKYYRDMLLIRRFEEKCTQLYGMGLIGGFCHLYIGQEAVVTGVQAAMRESDSVITSYRDHGHMLATGMDPKRVMAELLGRIDGCSKGKGGSMHMFDTNKRFYGGHGIVGAQVPLGTGIAFAEKYRGTDNICATYFGDGTVNQGQVYEAFNMAALWKLPVLYIIENNEYAMGTSVKRSCSMPDMYRRGESFNIPGKRIDGMDVVKVNEAAKEAIDFIRAGNGPVLLEMKTYRYRGHSMSDPAKYRTKEEVEQMRTEHDPIDNIKKLLEAKGLSSEEAMKAIDKETRFIVDEAVEFAKNSPEPDAGELYTDIYNE
jgi:pyruvate dehydrogenase E1 component alpha subunit